MELPLLFLPTGSRGLKILAHDIILVNMLHRHVCYIYIYICIYIYIYIYIYRHILTCQGFISMVPEMGIDAYARDACVRLHTCPYGWYHVHVVPCARLMSLCISNHCSICIHNNMHVCTYQTQSYTSKGMCRRGIGSFVRNSYLSTPCPLVICPYLCTSDKH